MDIKKILICPKCKSGQFSKNKNQIICNSCNIGFYYNEKNNQVIFEEVYRPNKVSEDVFTFKNGKHDRLSWRELNYLKIKKYTKTIPKDKLCLDIGCGPMTNKNLLNKFDSTIYVDGAKFNSVNIVCDFEKLIPIKDSSVDFILLSNVLEHMFNPQLIFNEIYRILKTNGKCLILVPYLIKLHQEPYDYFRYTKHALERFLKNSKFSNFLIEEMGSTSNIIINFLSIDMQTKRNINLFNKKIIFFLQWIIYKLYTLQRRFDSSSVNALIPQGYSIEIKK
jgi:SAM-dependent methyltransferase